MGSEFSDLFKKSVIVEQTGEKQRKKGSALLALCEQKAANGLQFIGIVEGGHQRLFHGFFSLVMFLPIILCIFKIPEVIIIIVIEIIGMYIVASVV